MPTNQALQVFYGSIPLIVVLGGLYFREQMLLKDVLTRLGSIESKLANLVERIIRLEGRAGIVYMPTSGD